jgi:hypothetical protein
LGWEQKRGSTQIRVGESSKQLDCVRLWKSPPITPLILQPFLRSLTTDQAGITFSGSSSGLAADLSGPVVSVFGGDTIEVLRNQRGEHIR